MLFTGRISYEGRMIARNRAEATRHAQEEVFEQAGESSRAYQILSLEQVPEENEWDVTPTWIYGMDVREDVDVKGVKRLGPAGDRIDSEFTYRVELDIVVEADTIEEARKLASAGPPRDNPQQASEPTP